jgi:heme oxygenase
VTFPGLGSADWVELDLDVFDIEQQVNVRSLLEAAAETVGRLVGDHYLVEPSNDGTAHIVVEGVRRYHAEANAAGRLVLTVVPDPEGPL